MRISLSGEPPCQGGPTSGAEHSAISCPASPTQAAPSNTAFTTSSDAGTVRSLSTRSRSHVNSLSALPVRKTSPPWSPRSHGSPARCCGVRPKPEANQRLRAFARTTTRPKTAFECFACPCPHTVLGAWRCFNDDGQPADSRVSIALPDRATANARPRGMHASTRSPPCHPCPTSRTCLALSWPLAPERIASSVALAVSRT